MVETRPPPTKLKLLAVSLVHSILTDFVPGDRPTPVAFGGVSPAVQSVPALLLRSCKTFRNCGRSVQRFQAAAAFPELKGAPGSQHRTGRKTSATPRESAELQP